jgi:HK97 family phage portal protein
MFGLSKRERLERQVVNLRLEMELRELRDRAAAPRIENSAGTTATYPLSDPLAYEKLFGPRPAGVSVDKAMTHSAFYRCVFLIAGSISMLPFNVYKIQPNGHRELVPEHPVAKLIGRRPNERLSPSIYWRSVTTDMLTAGNGVAWIERKSIYSPQPKALHYVPWSRAGVRLDRFENEPLQTYVLTLDDGRMVTAHQDDVLHIPGSAYWQIFRAMSPLTAYAMAVGIGISADAFAKAYFDNGATPDGYITYPGGLIGEKGKDAKAESRKYWMAQFGGDSRFAGPAILTDGGKFEQAHINAADAQLLDSRRFTVEDVCRVFGVPLHLVSYSDKATPVAKGLEEQTQSFVDFTLGPHLKAIEDEVNHKLIRDPSFIAEFDREAFVRGDMKARMEAYQIALGGNNGPGVMTQNEVRGKLNLGRSDDPAADRLVTWKNGKETAAQNADQGGAASPSPPEPSPAKPNKS